MNPPLLELSGIIKQFPGCLANDDVDLTVDRNQIHALLGENGAGKSTLVKIIYGVMRPDAGAMIWQGEPVVIQNPAHARRLGIGMVFQHFSLFEALTVAENIALGLNDARDRLGLHGRIIEVSRSYGLPVDPDKRVHDLSVGERQRIEVVRCLLQNPKLLIMNEPTSVLTPQEVELLFATLRRLAAEGCSILYISHKLEEVRALCQAATVMRLGRVVAHCTPREKTAQELASIMISAELKPASERRAVPAVGKPRLVLDRLNLRANSEFGTSLQSISVSVAGGEILGIAGVAGNGQGELMAALSGETLAGRPEMVIVDTVPAGVLVMSQPTWGLDAGAALAIHEAIIALAAAGAAVVVISQDLDEIFLLSDRIAVIAAGRLSEAIPVREASLERIGLLMGGVSAAPADPVHA